MINTPLSIGTHFCNSKAKISYYNYLDFGAISGTHLVLRAEDVIKYNNIICL